MCLTIEATVLEIKGKKVLADFGEFQKEVVSPLTDLKKGDKVRCFGGFIIEKIA